MQKRERATFPQPRQEPRGTRQKVVMKEHRTRAVAAAHQSQAMIRDLHSTTN